MRLPATCLPQTTHLTQLWHDCASPWPSPRRVAPGLRWDSARRAFVPPEQAARQRSRRHDSAADQILQRPVTWEDTIRPEECCDLFFVPRPRGAVDASYKFGEPFRSSMFLKANGYSRLTSKTVPSILHYDDRRNSVCKDAAWACSHWPAPMAIATTHRPGPVVVWQVGSEKYVGLLVPKSGSTTLVQTARESERLLNASFYLSRTIIDACPRVPLNRT